MNTDFEHHDIAGPIVASVLVTDRHWSQALAWMRIGKNPDPKGGDLLNA
jgi:hypothetical protein